MSDKSEKLVAQMGTIQQQLLKWNVELNDFQKWDLDNNGILDEAEKAALDSRKVAIAQILKRLEDIAKLKGFNLPLVILEGKDSNTTIPKKGFAETIEEIIADYKEAILELKNDESISIIKIQIDYNWESKFIFSTHNDQIITDLKADFLKVLNKSGAKTLGELADLLIEMLGTYNKDYIAKYYGKEYKGKAITAEIIKGMFPGAAKLKKAIESGIDKNDPNHPEKKAAENEKQKAEKEKLEASYKEFDKKLMTWNADCDEQIEYKSDSFQLKKISKTLAEKRANIAFSGIYTTAFSQYILIETLKRIPIDDSNGLNSNNLLEMMDVLKNVIAEAVQKFERKSNYTLFESWAKYANVFPSPGKLRDWAIMSVPVSKLEFEENIKWWINNTQSAVADSYKDKSNVRFDKKRLLREISPCFNYLSPIPAELFDKYILPILSSAGQSTLTVKELDELWIKALANLSKSSSAIYENLLSRGIPMADLPNLFPHASSIAVALDQSEFVAAAPQKPMVEDDKLLLKIELKISTLPQKNDFLTIIGQTAGFISSGLALDTVGNAKDQALYEAYVKTNGTIVFEIPLNYENFKVNSKNGAKEVWFAVPKADSVTMSFKDSTLAVSNPRIRATNSGIIEETNLTKKYQISFDFSLPQEVVGAAVTASTSGGVVVVDYERSSSFETSYNLDAKKNTIKIDFDLHCIYFEGFLDVEAIDKTIKVDIPNKTTAGWFTYEARSVNKTRLKPFSK